MYRDGKFVETNAFIRLYKDVEYKHCCSYSERSYQGGPCEHCYTKADETKYSIVATRDFLLSIHGSEFISQKYLKFLYEEINHLGYMVKRKNYSIPNKVQLPDSTYMNVRASVLDKIIQNTKLMYL